MFNLILIIKKITASYFIGEFSLIGCTSESRWELTAQNSYQYKCNLIKTIVEIALVEAQHLYACLCSRARTSETFGFVARGGDFGVRRVLEDKNINN